MRPEKTTTMHAVSERVAATLRAAPAAASGPARRFGTGRRRLRRLWHHVWPVALTLLVFATLIVGAIALRVAIWVPLHRF
jgi:hypothetical protein